MQFLKLVLRNALRHKLRTALTVLGLLVAVAVLRPAPDRGRRLVRGRERRRARSPRDAQRDLARLPDAAALPREDPRGAGGEAVRVRELVRRHLPGPKKFFPQFAVDAHTVFRDVSRVPLRRGREARVPARPPRRDRRPQARRPTASRSATRCRCAARSSPATGVHGARRSTTAPRRAPTPRQMFFHWEYLNETMKRRLPRRADQVGRVRGADRRPGALGGRSRRRSTRSSGTRPPRR